MEGNRPGQARGRILLIDDDLSLGGCHQSPSATIDFHPAHFVAIDRHMGVKPRSQVGRR
jgi:hypothetical protein